ncbi:MAG: tRNA pseudouridine(38-40) synthase TruA, partial [Nitrococcus sp.]|nr:tRNA pseudouridine(38-40) synthase TruA [Nitrococcus sp.]
MRIALGIEYDGTRFSGWQRQSHRPSVQAALEQALSRVADHAVSVTCAGRTDAGVHATHQVIHFDTQSPRSPQAWIRGVNSNLPDDIRVIWMRAVAQDFHARFAAMARAYRYVILSRPVPPALHRERVAWTWHPLELAPMRAAAQHLLGEHDFSSYRALACQARHPVRTLHCLDITRCGDYFYVDVAANAFLHHMVRNIAGVLLS